MQVKNLPYLNIMRKLLILIFLGLTLPGMSSVVFAQQHILEQNLSEVKVDDLSNAQVLRIRDQLNDAGIKDDQMSSALQNRGLPAEEASKFIIRVKSLKQSKSSTDLEISGAPDEIKEMELSVDNNNVLSRTERKIFGMSLFSMSNSPINPNLNITPTDDYILGPKDQLQIHVSGNSVVSWDVAVYTGGYIMIPQGIGKVYVGGKTLAEATELIKSKLMANSFQIGNGTYVDVTITNIRTINVTILGEVKKPGSYLMSSMQTLFNALYISGGPNINGSFRNISVIRGNQVVETLDIYDFLLYGDMSHNIRLEDNDIIRVPVYDVRVEVDGEVKRPGIYELLPGNTLKDVIFFAGGVTDLAYTSRIKIEQTTDKDKRVMDIGYKDFNNYVPLRGDKVTVSPILDRYQNRITISGAVFRPGEYELHSGMTLKQLIEKSEGLKEDAFLQRGYITRLKADNTQEIISFNASDILNGRRDIPLQREDIVTIPSIFDLKDNPIISVQGAVRNAGRLPFLEGMSINDAILQAGGFLEGANPHRIQVARRVKDSDRSRRDANVATVFDIDMEKDLSGKDFQLEPYDIISVFSLPGYEQQQTVRIEGEVMKPGIYAIIKKNERISDLVKRSGGLTAFAYIDGASLKRGDNPETSGEKELRQLKSNQFEKAQEDAIDSTGVKINLRDKTLRNNFVGIDLNYILAHPGSSQDLFLEDNDVLTIPKRMQTVQVSGQVLWPTTVLWESGKSLKEYIISSGGFAESAFRKKVYVFGANGKAATTRNFLFFKRYPKIKPGSEIFVPEKVHRGEPMSAQAWIGLSTSMASLAAIIFSIVTLNQR